MPALPSAKRVFDGSMEFSGGVDSGKSPTIAGDLNPTGLLRNQIAFGINCTMRGGRIKPRPGLKKLPIGSFGQQGCRFQGASFYQADDGNNCVVAAIDGHFLKFNVGSDYSVSDITPSDGPNPYNRERVNFLQAENYLIGLDGQTRNFIYDGGASRRANENEIPPGTVGAYNKGRIWLALENGITFIASDIVYGNGNRSDVLKVTESTFLNGGGFFTVPANSGPICAMRPMANIDVSMGQGPLLVFTDNTIFSVDAPVDRTTWQTLNYPIQTVAQITYGGTSQNSTVVVNGDVFYRAPDGVRSFYIARRNYGQWANTPISNEMNRVLERDTKHLLGFSSAVVFDNRLLMTCSPVASRYGTYHRGLMSMDFDLVSGMRGKLPPAWEGLWVSQNILQLVVGRFRGVDRCFAFVLSSTSQIELWEITTEAKFDFDGSDRRITWTPEFGSFTFGKPFQLKRLESGDLWIDRLTGTVDFELSYRPDQHPCYIPWEEWQVCAKYQDCDTDECGVPVEYKEQYRPRKRFKSPDESCNNILGTPFCDGFEFQPKLSITGFCEIKQLRLQAFERVEPMVGECS